LQSRAFVFVTQASSLRVLVHARTNPRRLEACATVLPARMAIEQGTQSEVHSLVACC
jgi:hypothetical protein